MRRRPHPFDAPVGAGSDAPAGLRRLAAGALALSVAAAILAAPACGPRAGVAAPEGGSDKAGAPPPAGTPATAPATAQPATPTGPAARIATAPVTVRDVTSTIEALGSIEAEEEVRVVAAVEGLVTRVRFREGDRVTPDSVLAEIDPERYRLLADQARARVETAVAEQRRAEADLRRREELLTQDPPLVSAEEVERARQEAERLRAAAAVARAASDLAEQDRRRSIVRPLVPGIINSRSVNTGQHVESKDIIATLVDTRRLRLRFKVSEAESVRLRDGMQVSFTASAWPGRAFSALIFHVSSAAEAASRMVEVLARVEDPDPALKPGFFAEVQAAVDSRKDALLVPERAVLATDRGFVVFEVRDGVARLRPVTLGLRTGDGAVEILSGLTRDAVVVTDGGAILKDGSPVVDAASPPS
jgi:membrane fusion protein (multidrug efflux system)/multidrug efflux system membrane fusion protein